MPSYPGLPLPVNADFSEGFPKAFSEWGARPITALEKQMLQLVDVLTDKPDWTVKIFDPVIRSKWRYEAINAAKSMIDDAAFDYCLAELEDKAEYWKRSGLISVLDTEAQIVKSDSLVSAELMKKLQDACQDLIAEQGDAPDMHPGTFVQDLIHPSICPLVYGLSRVHVDEIVGLANAVEKYSGTGHKTEPGCFDAPHPILPDTERKLWSTRFQWLPSNFTCRQDGSVETQSYINGLSPRHHASIYRTIETVIDVAVPAWEQCLTIREEIWAGRWWGYTDRPIENMADSTQGRRIGIRAAEQFEHPALTREFYKLFKKYEKRTKQPAQQGRNHQEVVVHTPITVRPGMIANEWGAQGHPCGLVMDSKDLSATGVDLLSLCEDEYEAEECEAFIGEHEPVLFPSAPKYAGRQLESTYNLRDKLKSTGLQVIVKMVDMSGKGADLDTDDQFQAGFPTNPGSWHVEGQLNEHIVATALVYFDTANIEPETLAFRQRLDADDLGYTHEMAYHQNAVFDMNFDNETARLQGIGSVETRQGRLIAFPNIFHHAVSGLQLTDKSKPAHRRFIALWLVDPQVRIISTANVPPQQMTWWLEEVLKRKVTIDEEDDYLQLIFAASELDYVKKLPAEIVDMIRVYTELDRTLLMQDDINRIQGDLMAERTRMSNDFEHIVDEETFNFCEH